MSISNYDNITREMVNELCKYNVVLGSNVNDRMVRVIHEALDDLKKFRPDVIDTISKSAQKIHIEIGNSNCQFNDTTKLKIKLTEFSTRYVVENDDMQYYPVKLTFLHELFHAYHVILGKEGSKEKFSVSDCDHCHTNAEEKMTIEELNFIEKSLGYKPRICHFTAEARYNYLLEKSNKDVKLLPKSLVEEVERNKTFIKAAEEGDLKILQTLLAEGKIDSDVCERAIKVAKKQKNIKVLILFLNVGFLSKGLKDELIRWVAFNGDDGDIEALLSNCLVTQSNRSMVAQTAAQAGRVDLVKKLLAHTGSQADREEAVCAAAVVGKVDVVRELGPVPRSYYKQVIPLVAQGGYADVLRELLANGAISDFDRGKAVITAAGNGHVDVIKELLANGAISDQDRGKAVIAVAGKGYVHIIKKLFALNGAISDEDRKKAVIIAGGKGHAPVIRELLADAKPDLLSQEEREKIVHSATGKGNAAVIKEVLAHNGLISKQNRAIAVYQAASDGYADVIRELLARGTIYNDDRDSAILTAQQAGHTEAVKALKGE